MQHKNTLARLCASLYDGVTQLYTSKPVYDSEEIEERVLLIVHAFDPVQKGRPARDLRRYLAMQEKHRTRPKFNVPHTTRDLSAMLWYAHTPASLSSWLLSITPFWHFATKRTGNRGNSPSSPISPRPISLCCHWAKAKR